MRFGAKVAEDVVCMIKSKIAGGKDVVMHL
jgi:hypothetical protein